MMGECQATGINVYDFFPWRFCDTCPLYDKYAEVCRFMHTDIENRRQLVSQHQKKIFEKQMEELKKRS